MKLARTLEDGRHPATQAGRDPLSSSRQTPLRQAFCRLLGCDLVDLVKRHTHERRRVSVDDVQSEEVLRRSRILVSTLHFLVITRRRGRERLGEVMEQAVLEGSWECRVEQSVELRGELSQDTVARCQ